MVNSLQRLNLDNLWRSRLLQVNHASGAGRKRSCLSQQGFKRRRILRDEHSMGKNRLSCRLKVMGIIILASAIIIAVTVENRD